MEQQKKKNLRQIYILTAIEPKCFFLFFFFQLSVTDLSSIPEEYLNICLCASNNPAQ